MGQKLTVQQFRSLRNLNRGKTMMMEMRMVLISVRTTHLDVVGWIAGRNVETAVQLYAGGIKCKSTQLSCLLRKEVGKYVFRSMLDIYSSLRSTSQEVCLMDGARIPYGVMMKNSEHGRGLDDPKE